MTCPKSQSYRHPVGKPPLVMIMDHARHNAWLYTSRLSWEIYTGPGHSFKEESGFASLHTHPPGSSADHLSCRHPQLFAEKQLNSPNGSRVPSTGKGEYQGHGKGAELGTPHLSPPVTVGNHGDLAPYMGGHPAPGASLLLQAHQLLATRQTLSFFSLLRTSTQ